MCCGKLHNEHDVKQSSILHGIKPLTELCLGYYKLFKPCFVFAGENKTRYNSFY